MAVHPIARYRRLKGWTQADLAEHLGVSLNTVQRWEKGRVPRPGHFAALASALGINTLQLDAALQEWGSKRGELIAA